MTKKDYIEAMRKWIKRRQSKDIPTTDTDVWDRINQHYPALPFEEKQMIFKVAEEIRQKVAILSEPRSRT